MPRLKKENLDEEIVEYEEVQPKLKPVRQIQNEVMDTLTGDDNDYNNSGEDSNIPEDIIYTTIKHDEMMQKLEMEGFEVNIQLSTPKDPLRPVSTKKKGSGRGFKSRPAHIKKCQKKKKST